MSGVAATQTLRTIVDLLIARARERSDLRLFTFLGEDGEEVGWSTSEALDCRARTIAALLQERCLAGERALLLFPPGLDFIAAFLGCLYAGVIAVPAYPPRASRHSSRLRAIAKDALPSAVLTPAAAVSRAEERLRAESGLEGAAWLGIGDLPPELADAWRRPRIDGATLAFLQYTSGSTSSPKGVMVSHANLLHNQRLIQRAFRQSEESVVVGWLPLYHDMGLIGNVLQPLYSGGRCILMSPLTFLQQPVRWLEAISRYRGTTSGGPNFAYDLCARKIPPAERERLDLGSWEVAFNGAEPVRADTLERFARTFAPQGFRREAFHPCYGLAEATLLVTGEPEPGGPTLRELGTQSLAADRAAEPAPGEEGRRLVGSGKVAGDQRIAVVEPLSGTELPDGAVGEIWVAGPSVADGYFRRPDMTAEVFAARLANGEGPFLRTGDLGFVERGELFVTGRLKDLIIVRGRNHYPQDLELSVERVDPALRPGCGAAFSCEIGGEERLVVVQEVERRAGISYESLAERVAQAVAEEHEIQLHQLVLIRAGTVPKTTSGKIQRRAAREAYLAGDLTVVFASRTAEGPAAPETAGAADFDAASLSALPTEERRATLVAGLRELAVRALRLPTERVEPAQHLVRLGLDSLGAVELQHELESRLGVPVLPGDLLEDQDLSGLAAALLDRLAARGDQAPPPALTGEAGAEELPLSHGQEALWVLHRLAPESGAYHVAAVARVRPALDPAALRRALAALAARHPALRATFEALEGEPRQRVRARLDPSCSVLEAGTGAELERRLLREAYAPFDLQTGPLLRIAILRAAGEDDRLLVTAHHIVTDFESMGILARELAAFYAHERGGPAPALPPLADYGASLRWQRQLAAGPAGEALWEHWRTRLTGAPAALELPTDRPRPPMQTFAGRAERLRLDAETAAGLAGLARSSGATLFAVLLSVFQTLLHRLSGQDDLVVGSPVTSRTRPELAGLIGYFVNPLALRAELAGDPPFAELLGRTRRTVLDALAHRSFPFPLLAERLQPERDPSRSPLFQAMFTLQRASRPEERGLAAFALSMEGGRLELGGLELESCLLPERWAQLDLNLRMGEVEGGVAAWLQYSSDLFDATTARRLLGQISTLARAAVEAPGSPLSALPLLSPAERSQLLTEWNDTRTEVPGPGLIHRLFELQADRSPGAEAVVFDGIPLTYGNLELRANRLAHHLRSLGLGPDGRAGVCLDRSADLVVALLAVLKAGAAYVPLDPAYPGERLAYVMADAGIQLLITQERHAGGFALPRERQVLLGSDRAAIASRPSGRPDVPCPPESLAYLIYTSGSTGNPKGVMVTHRNVASFFAAMDDRLGTVPGCWLAVTSVSFDISVLELLWTLARGWKVVVQREPRTSAAPVRSLPEISLFYFASEEGGKGASQYRLLLEGAKLADRHGFAAVWTPERHFHAFGALYPNPAVTGAAVAAVTERVGIRAGSVVLPLHHPLRVAEEWSVVDNLSGGRVGLSFASGWNPADFVFAPDAYATRREALREQIETVRRLWRGEPFWGRGGAGEVEVTVLPRPVQPELPVWITAAGSPDTFRLAGEMGAHLLTHLLGQSPADLAGRIAIYRRAWQESGHPGRGQVALMLHTFVGEDPDFVRETVREPFSAYLATSFDLMKDLAPGQDLRSLKEEERRALAARAFDRYFETSGLFGTPEDCLRTLGRLQEIGVDEIACLIDFGVGFDEVMESLRLLATAHERGRSQAAEAGVQETIPRQIVRHAVTHLQCTPSAATAILLDPEAEDALRRLDRLLLGGEALPPALADHLGGILGGELLNMYGPTETTIWSATDRVEPGTGVVTIGRPIANTGLYLLDPDLAPVPVGRPGEIYIGGEGVVRGYWSRPALTAERFVPAPFGSDPGGRLYRTGDLARWRGDGRVAFLGRVDHQVKVRGHRIELGEIEAVLGSHPGVREAAVVAREDRPGDVRLIAYVAPRQAGVSREELTGFLRSRLPEPMVPSACVLLESLPHTPNGKVDRRALPAVEPARTGRVTAPRTPAEELLAGIFGELLGIEGVGAEDHFFELGGHSLLAMQLGARLRSTFGVELPVRTLFETPTVEALAARLEQARRGGGRLLPPLLPAPRGGTPPLSFAQERLWLLAQLAPEDAAYHEAQAVWLQGPLAAGAMAAALSEIARRHEALRTSFVAVDGRPAQKIHPPQPVALPLIDLGALPAAARGPAARGLAREWRGLPFDLERGPLMRAALLRLDREEHVVLLVLHHLVADGWSQALLMRELSALYGALTAGLPSPLPELPVQYADFAVWQRSWLTDEVLAPQLAYWRARLGDDLELLDLPADRPRPAVQTSRGARHRLAWDGELAAALRRLSGQAGATPFMTLLAAFQTLLSRYTARERLNVGTPIAGRRQLATEPLIGCFVNTLVLRADLTGAPGFGELLRRTREAALEAYDHQDLPFERLVEALQPERSLSHTPVFQHLFVLQDATLEELDLPGLRVRPFEGMGNPAKLDLLLSMAATDTGLAGTLEYNTDLFDASRIERMARHLRSLLEGGAADPFRPITELPLLSAAEIAQLEAWNDTARDHEARCLHELFEAQVARTPAAEALVDGVERWTYAELDAWANRLAWRLRTLGVRPETRVGVFLERSAGMVACLLGILKAGGAYAPLDPAYPAERLSFMLEDAGISVVLASRGLRDRLPAGAERVRVVLPEEVSGEAVTAPPPSAGPGNLAYLIYTSGSTGRPKAVAIEHRSASVLVHWAREAFPPAELAGVLAATSISFDLSVFELFVPLSWGGKVILAANALELPALPAAAEVTLVNTVPSAMAELVRADAVPAGVRVVSLAGEALPRPLVDRIYAGGRVERVLNLYGPSEDTTYSTWAVIAPGSGREPAIGRPLADTRAYLLDRHGQRMPVGVPGELFLAGGGLARGYLGRPELTAERFVPDPFGAMPGARMYRTGDLARFLSDGELEFLGRIDHQVKVRGFRVELGEIESTLLAAGAREAAVLVREDRPGDRRLVAYVTGDADVASLRSALMSRLPEPMVPADFVTLAALPRTPNGKLDRRELQRLRPARSAAGPRESGYVAPRTPIEEVLARIYAEVLDDQRIGAHDHFFELGGHSLLAMRLVARVRTAFGLELPLRAVFESPQLADLAARIAASFGHAAPAPIPRAPRDGRLELSFAQERLWFLDQLEPGSPAYNMPAALRLSGRLDVAALATVLGEIGRRHEVLRTTFPARAGRPVQAISPAPGLGVPVIDLGSLPPGLAEREAERLAAGEARLPFALDRGPLLRPRLLRLRPDAHLLLLTMHHIVSDGGSLGILLRELATLYGAVLRGEASPLPELPIQYADFARWQRDHLQGEALAGEIEHWRRELESLPAALALPTDRPRRALSQRRSGRRSRTLRPELAAALAELGRREGVTQFMALLAGFAVVLGRAAAERDLAIGAPVANRGRIETEGLVGLFVNTLVHRVRLDGAPNVRELLRRVRETALRAYSHQDLPFEQLVEALQPGRDLTRTPLFQVLLVIQGAPGGELELPGLSLRPVEADTQAAKLDLTLTLVEREGAVVLRLEHDRHLFDPATAERLLGQLESWLAGAAAAGPEPAADALPLLGAGERHQIVREWNDSAGTAEPAIAQERFEQAARSTPDAVALVFEEERLTFGELDARANQLARHLRARGVGPEVRVGLLTARSAEMIVGLLGILKAGGAYLPMDPGQPRERIAFLLADADAPVVVTQGELLAALPPGPWQPICLDLDAERIAGESGLPLPAAVLPENLAYVIYTSGSTGRPKGVGVEHRQLANYLDAVLERIAPFAPESYATVSTLAADLGNTVVFAALCTGRALHVVAQDRIADAARLAEYLRAHPVDCLKIVPSHLQALLAAAEPAALLPRRLLILGGEASDWEWIEGLAAAVPGCGILNHYGPTETTVGVATFRFSPAAGVPHPAALPLGRPLRNVRIHLLDSRLQPVPPGAPGELCVGGTNVSRGYLGRGDLTAERFIPDPLPLGPGERMYRTGDLARRLADGRIEFLGRIDQQIKIRGFRVELGEIEAALAAHPGVRDALVSVREVTPGDRRLVAFVVPAPGPRPEAAELRELLAERLPDFMVPSAIVALDALPLGPTGKVDRQAAARLEVRLDGGTADDPRPRTPVEEVVAEIWSGVLGRERIGLHESFFAAGGHSLMATRVISALRSAFGLEIPLRRLFESPTIAGLSAWIEAARTPGLPPAPPILPADDARAPLSFAQERLWFLDQLGEEGAAYVLPYYAELKGQLDRSALELALDAVVDRQRELRAAFPARQGRPERAIRPRLALGLPLVDLSGLPAAAGMAAARGIAEAEARRPFDLAAGPLVRAALVRCGERRHLLLLTLHHAVSDAWSRGILMRELAAFYEAACEGRPCELPELPVQYTDFARWQRERIQGEVLEGLLGYWRQRLAGLPALELPTDRPRPAAQTFRGTVLEAVLGPALAEGVRALARREGATLFMALLAAFHELLHRYSGQRDLAVGSPIANRTRTEIEGVVGFFVNTLVLRGDLAGRPSFGELLGRARETALGAYAHQDLPFEKLVEELRPERSQSRSPLFQALLVLQNVDLPEHRMGSLALRPLRIDTGTAKFDLTLFVLEEEGTLRLRAEHNRDLFDGVTVRRLLSHFETLLASAVRSSAAPLCSLPLTGEVERHHLLEEWNEGRSLPSAEPACLHDLIAAQASRTPGAVALVTAAERLTYGELDERSNQLAHRLRSLGVGPEARVGICLRRTADMVVSLLAVLKAGGAYVPLDPAYPQERLAFLIADASVEILITQEELRGALPGRGARALILEEERAAIDRESRREPRPRSVPESLAYLIYTSGSTGRPKGVAITHRSAVAFLRWCATAFTPAELAGVLASTSLNFDISVFEMFAPLALGGTVLLATDALELPSLAAAGEVTLLNTVPSAAAELVRVKGLPAGLRTVCLAGEPLLRPLVDGVAAHRPVRRVLNLYGPSEDTTFSTFADVPLADGSPPTIGRPLAGSAVYLLGSELSPVPLGAAGELYIAGAGLARGYLGRPDLTAERFIPDPFGREPGGRIYRTGDLARYRRDGEIQFLGRIDHQVKIRGFRIELGEIEQALADHPGVRESAVLVRESAAGDRTLAAYVATVDGASLDAPELRRFLREKLPAHMVPAAFVLLAALPRSPNGKLDRAALRALPALPDATTAAVAPRTLAERVVAELWAEVLGLPQVGIFDDFFDLGGHSLLATQVVSRLRETFPVDLSLRSLYDRRTVAELAAVIEAKQLAALEPAGLAGLLDDLAAMSDEEAAAFLNELPQGDRNE